MNPEGDTEYYLKREVEERFAANSATDTAARDIHLALAARHAVRASAALLRWSYIQVRTVPARSAGIDHRQD